MTRSTGILLGVAALVAVLAFLVGRELRPQDANAAAFDLGAPAYAAPKTAAGLSKAGFSGFVEADGADGRTVVAGKVVAMTSDTVTLETAAGQRSTVRLTGSSRLQRLEASSMDALRPGAAVLVRVDGDEAKAVLLVAEPAR